MITVNAIGENCPIPVIKTQNVIKTITTAEQVEVFVDNEIAVQNVMKLASSKGFQAKSEKLEEKRFRVVIDVPGNEDILNVNEESEKEVCCIPDSRKNTVVVVSSSKMGEGNEELGKVLIKGFIYALTQLDELPSTILFYNGGATLTCEGSQSVEDLKSLEAQGVEILTCGTCLNYYGISDKLQVGGVTNMYVIAEKMMKANLIVKP